jgi:STE24 endopeptidase
LAHAERNDVWRGLLWVAIVSPLAVLFVALLGDRLASGDASSRGSSASLPALVLAIALAITAIQIVGNGLSRAVEKHADVRALELTDSPRALIGLQRRLAEANLTQPDPPGWSQFLFGTHPTTDQRIGLALAWERGDRPR